MKTKTKKKTKSKTSTMQEGPRGEDQNACTGGRVGKHGGILNRITARLSPPLPNSPSCHENGGRRNGLRRNTTMTTKDKEK